MRLAVASLILLLAGCGGQDRESALPAPEATEVALVAPRTTIAPPPGCSTAVQPFVPTEITITGVDVPVMALGRDENNVPGVPPLGAKFDVAWDAPGVQPGSSRGNVLLNTHTWPDGSALGNRFLDQLQQGDRFVLRNGEVSVCYRVTERTEVSIENPPLDRVYDEEGPAQAVLIVCSGTRTGPGQWTHRTLWFATPLD
ncbi:MAG TPA: class F sortase [Nocardioidaceae bacterium]|nr:class F sortase [Nocardioidaceae bacterium]